MVMHSATLFHWKYEAKIENDDILINISPPHKKDKPRYLSKYYSLSENSLEALKKGYLYASHPSELNDPFECFIRLINYDNLTIEECVSLMCPPYRKDEIVDLFNNSKSDLTYLIRESYWPSLYTQLGLISMSSNPLDMKMWSHYSKHVGFQVVFDIKALPPRFKGPFPINYRNSFQAIDFMKYDRSISLLYQTNIKSNEWKHEREWRFLVFDSNLYSPINIETQKNPKPRKFEYPKSAINEIIIGFRFFEPKNMPDKNSYSKFKYVADNEEDKNKMILLDYICDNPNIKTSYLNIKTDKFHFAKVPIKITRVGDKTYELKNRING
jgi:Protein of unknown function (DUF2971)